MTNLCCCGIAAAFSQYRIQRTAWRGGTLLHMYLLTTYLPDSIALQTWPFAAWPPPWPISRDVNSNSANHHSPYQGMLRQPSDGIAAPSESQQIAARRWISANAAPCLPRSSRGHLALRQSRCEAPRLIEIAFTMSLPQPKSYRPARSSMLRFSVKLEDMLGSSPSVKKIETKLERGRAQVRLYERVARGLS